MVLLIVLNRPRVDLLWRDWVPPLLPVERREKFPILSLQTMRASHSCWIGRPGSDGICGGSTRPSKRPRLGIGRDGIRAAFGRLDMPLLPAVYDARTARPARARGHHDPEQIRRALGPYVFKETEPGPPGSLRASPGPRRSAPLVRVGRGRKRLR